MKERETKERWKSVGLSYYLVMYVSFFVLSFFSLNDGVSVCLVKKKYAMFTYSMLYHIISLPLILIPLTFLVLLPSYHHYHHHYHHYHHHYHQNLD